MAMEIAKVSLQLRMFTKRIKVTKFECIGHVQKRVGTALRKVRKEKKLGGKGKLTDKMIDRLQNYYGVAV